MSDSPSVPAVLIADDDPAIRGLMTAVCKRFGYTCDGARDGEEALEKIRSKRYDVLLLDLMMPKVSGEQVIAALREMKVKPAVIVLTAQPAKISEPAVAAVDGGRVVQAVLTKPFDLDALGSLLVDTAKSVHEHRKSAVKKVKSK